MGSSLIGGMNVKAGLECSNLANPADTLPRWNMPVTPYVGAPKRNYLPPRLTDVCPAYAEAMEDLEKAIADDHRPAQEAAWRRAVAAASAFRQKVVAIYR